MAVKETKDVAEIEEATTGAGGELEANAQRAVVGAEAEEVKKAPSEPRSTSGFMVIIFKAKEGMLEVISIDPSMESAIEVADSLDLDLDDVVVVQATSYFRQV
jgi:hypothetical protein